MNGMEGIEGDLKGMRVAEENETSLESVLNRSDRL